MSKGGWVGYPGHLNLTYFNQSNGLNVIVLKHKILKRILHSLNRMQICQQFCAVLTTRERLQVWLIILVTLM